MVVTCYYETLDVSQDATDEELKKSYRKLALKWHPDKNLDNVEEAKEQFQLVQQAYEVLNDPQERAWYDKHRDSILKGGLGKDYNDESLNLYPFFTTSCFKGFGDDERGFYAVYREVFNKLAAEDSQYDSDLDSENEVPDFGDSSTSYDDKVHAFYGYWQSYTTKKSFSWLDEYDTRTAPNRRVARLMEKENKRLRDAARKERNEQVRALIAFVRKRDKRVQENAKLLEERAAQNAEKINQIKLKQRRERQEEIERQIKSQSEWSKFSNFEKQLKEIEENLATEFAEELSEECETGEEEEVLEESYSGNLYCSACNKLFKTEQAFSNHEKSKKHKDKVEEMVFSDQELDENYLASDREIDSDKEEVERNSEVEDLSQHSDPVQEQQIEIPSTSKKNKRKNKITVITSHSTDSENEDLFKDLSKDSDNETDKKKPKSRKNKRNKASIKTENKSDVKPDETAGCEEADLKSDHDSSNQRTKQKNVKVKNMNKPQQTQENKISSKTELVDNVKVDHICKACTSTFNSNNELFKHLRKTGHALAPSLSGSTPPQTTSRNKKRNQK